MNNNEKYDDFDLPFGWTYKNKDFIDPIQNKFSYFLNNWLYSRNKDTKTLYSALKSFVLFIEDARKICKKRGKLFLIWFLQSIASDDYLLERKNELKEIENNFDELVRQDEIKAKALLTLKDDLLNIISNNSGILQSDLYKMFDACLKENICTVIYYLCEDGCIVKEKSGRTYKLFMKEG